ncbi:MAG: CusA/CzcA family heavy metal efflux RND transporter [Crocinitomicaceae bacterium]
MIDKLIKFSINNKLVIGLFVLGLIAWGSYSLKQLPIDAVPDITNNQVQIITIAPSIAAQEVERLISFPIETTMATIPEVEEIRSFSRFGLSAVTIVFKDNVDVYWARQQVSERLVEAKGKIPNNIGTPEMAPVTTGLGEIYQYVVHTEPGYEDKYSPMELRTIQDWIIKRQLLGTPGVADVSSFGGYLKQYQIAVDPNQLKAMDVSIGEIYVALEQNNQNTGGAYIDKKPNAYFIRSEGMIASLEDIKKIVVKNTLDGSPVLIRDLAKVEFGEATRYGATVRNGEGEVVSAIVMMLKGENSNEVIANIKERIEQIKKTLPEGVTIEPFLDRSKLVDSAIGTVTKNLIEGALIVIFILILFLGNFRAGLIVASVIPLAMLFAISMMHLFGVSGNLMSLGAIDFGLIVDGAVIIVESILHRIVMNKKKLSHIKMLSQTQMDEEVYEASSKIRSTAAFGEIIILIVYLPILVLVGIEGKMFGPMAQTVSFAILGAFLLSLTYVPMMSALVLSKKTTHKENFSDRMMKFFQKLYAPLLGFALKRKLILLVSTVALFLFSLLVFNGLGGEFIPSLDEGDFAVETRVMSGSSLSETIDASNKASKLLMERFPEIEQVVGKIGSGEIPTDPMPVEACDLMIILKDKSEWTSAKTKDELAEKMGKALEDIPGVTFGFQQPIQMRFNELMTGARQDVVIKVYGDDLEMLTDYANQIGKLVKTVEGAEDLYVEEITGLPQIQIIFNRDEIAKYGLSIAEINQTIETAFAGKTAGIVYEGERRFDLVVRLDEQNRSGISDVANLFIHTANGDQIPLNQLAEVSFKEGPSQIQRDDTKRRITIGFNVRNRDVESIVQEIQEKVEKNVTFASGYYPTYGGQFKNLIEARSRLMIAVPVALLLIFILLFFTFRSMKQSLLIFTAIPLSAIGGIFALYLRDMPFSISAGVGFIALFGVAVLNGIVLIGEFNRLKIEGLEIKDRIVQGTMVRLRPVLMTALVASCGFLPMAISSSSGAEVQRPLATVVIGGLITATFLTLIVLPILYYYFENNKIKLKRMKNSTLILMLLLLPQFLSAQDSTVVLNSVDDAITIANERSLLLKAASTQQKINQENLKTSFDLGKTQVGWQHGQYNSVNSSDNYFDVSQSFAFPTVYINQSKVAKNGIESGEIRFERQRIELQSEIKNRYVQYLFLKEKVNLFQELDSNYAQLKKVARINFEAGNSTALDNLMMETSALEISNKLRSSTSDLAIIETSIKTLLNLETSTTLQVDDDSFTATSALLMDNLSIENNSVLKESLIDVQTKESLAKLERSRLFPDLSIGYFNQSLNGEQTVNGVNQSYGPRDRFQGFSVGVAIPIWIRPQLAKVNMADLQIQMSTQNAELVESQINADLLNAKAHYVQAQNTVLYYQENGLNQVEQLLNNAYKSLESGDISTIEHSQIMNQTIYIRLNYLQALLDYKISIIHIEYLTGVQQ